MVPAQSKFVSPLNLQTSSRRRSNALHSISIKRSFSLDLHLKPTQLLLPSFLRELYDGQFFVKLNKGYDFPTMDPWGTSDPYVVLQLDTQIVKSNIKREIATLKILKRPNVVRLHETLLRLQEFLKWLMKKGQTRARFA
ncbi:putative C2 domain superfamily protein [Helianthus anomalus]